MAQPNNSRSTIFFLSMFKEIKNIIESNFKGSINEYQEFHALLVEHAKHFYQKKEDYKKDFLLKV